VRILLPPSEAKNAGGRGRALSSRREHPLLGPARERAMSALDRLVAGPAADAAKALLLPPATVDQALAANAQVRTSPTSPALRRYAGVVYDGLASIGLDSAEQRLAGRSVLVFSGLFGVVRGDEAVPTYRVPAKAVLPGIGVASTFWRPVLDQVVPALLGHGPVIDLRSTDYAAMWRPRGEIAGRTVQVRVLSPLPSGAHGVVSYPSKFAKGRLAGALVRRAAAGRAVTCAEDVASAWLECGGSAAEVNGPGRVVVHTA
jgi:cytoplasmic iron level regulating protein YaaA (DUF328/UPF0246 family)